MDIGLVLQTTPPSARVVDLAKRAETYGFSHVWTFDSHILWQEPYVIYSQILAETRNVTVGPMVTNPATRDWTVTASVFATLNEMYGNRTVCGIGRGDSAVRVTNGKPTTIDTLRQAVHVIRELANGRSADYKGSTIAFPWASRSELEVWVAGYGPRALALAGEVGDGFILQLADPQIVAWTIGAVREAAERAGRDPDGVTICVAAPAYVGADTPETRAHMREQCRWFGGMVGNHVADLVGRYGDASDVPAALTEYIKGRQGYDYNEHGQAGNVHADFVPDEIVDRFCILGPVDEQLRRLHELEELGVDQFAIYLQHDGKDGTLQAYGEHVIPALARHVAAKPDVARKVGLFFLALVLVAGAWELYKVVGPEGGGGVLGWNLLPRSNDTAMPHVWDMGERLFDPESRTSDRPIWRVVLAGAWYSFRLAVAGFLLGTAVGILLAMVMARFGVVRRGLMPYLVVSQTVPMIALAPLVVSWGGRLHLGSWEWPRWLSVAVLGAFLAFFPVAVGTLRGLESASATSLELMRSFAATSAQTMRKLRFPAAVPRMVPALKLAATASVIGVVVAEISTGFRGGVGRLIIEYARQASGDPAKMYTALLGAAALGLAMVGVVAAFETVATRNRPEEMS